MSKQFVANLYDALHMHQARYRAGSVYPVHKKLRFDEPSIMDVYDWIIAEVGLPERGSILDAGCGVGFGTIRLAENCSSKVEGISISPREIETATKYARNSTSRGRLAFREASFDDLPSNAYDLIVAVESLKHSVDLGITLQSLCEALRPGGLIVIIDDFYTGSDDDVNALQAVRYWGLTRLYSEPDYRTRIGAVPCQVVDLNNYVRIPGLALRATRKVRQFFVKWFAKAIDPLVVAAFAGGIHLQNLYDTGYMRYQALIVTAPSDAAEQ